MEGHSIAGGSAEPDESRAALLTDAADRAGRYLRRLADRAVAPRPEAVLALAELDFPLPEAGLEPSRVLAILDDVGSPATVASAGPRYFGFVTGGLDILNEVRLNQVVAACADATATDQMIAAVQREGTCWCGPTMWRGRRAMRISISNWATTAADVDRSVAAVLAAADQAGAHR